MAMNIMEFREQIKKVLLTENVDELIKFIKENKEYYDRYFLINFFKNGREFQQLCLDKMIIASLDLPKDIRERAKERVKNGGQDL